MPLTKRQREILTFPHRLLRRRTATRPASRKSRRGSTITRWRRCMSTSPISSAKGTSSVRTTRAGPSRSCPQMYSSVPSSCRSWAWWRPARPSKRSPTAKRMAVPDGFLRRNGSHYVLKVRGESMIDEQIEDGDYVVVNERQSADNGEMVIALLDGAARHGQALLPRTGRTHSPAAGQRDDGAALRARGRRSDPGHCRGRACGVTESAPRASALLRWLQALRGGPNTPLQPGQRFKRRRRARAPAGRARSASR